MISQPLSIEDFDRYFAAVNDGHRPYDWQRSLLEFVVGEGRWPDRIDAPTGSGKSCVVEIHVFANALAAASPLAALPRRLVSVVGRRALVDAMEHRAQRLAAAIDDAANGTVLGAVRQALVCRAGREAARGGEVRVTSLRGGMPLSFGWRDDPLVCQVVCATPDMWGSAALFHGYGSSARARPRDAAMLVYDTVAILDESHLNRQLAVTGRRIADLTATEGLASRVPPLQFVEMTATHGDEDRSTAGTAVRLDWSIASADAEDRTLGAMLHRPKPISFLTVPEWPLPRHGRKRMSGLSAIVDAVAAERASVAGTVGCILNRVDDALEVSRMLAGAGLRTATLVGRMRPVELAALRAQHPDLLTTTGDPDVDVLVATQTLEVGVDVDLHALVTDLAPGSALAQRAGRLNRIGARAGGSITVVVPEHRDRLAESSVRRGTTAPYLPEDLAMSAEWLDRLAVDPAGMSPRALRDSPPPTSSQRRLLYSRLEAADVDLLVSTSEALFAEPDLTFWLRDELVEQPGVSIVARRLPDSHGPVVVVERGGPAEAADLELLAATPPLPHELYPCTMSSAREYLAQFGDDPRAYVWDAVNGSVRRFDGWLRPGDAVIVPAGICRGVSDGVITSRRRSRDRRHVGTDAIGRTPPSAAESGGWPDRRRVLRGVRHPASPRSRRRSVRGAHRIRVRRSGRCAASAAGRR